MRLTAVSAFLALALTCQASAQAPPGAATCSGCHPPRADAPGAAVPPLLGRPAREIEEAMLAYRAGTRPATLMNRIAKGFSEDEIRAIAVWLEKAKP